MRFGFRFHGTMLAITIAAALGAALPAGRALAGVPKVILGEEFGHVL